MAPPRPTFASMWKARSPTAKSLAPPSEPESYADDRIDVLGLEVAAREPPYTFETMMPASAILKVRNIEIFGIRESAKV
jgi:hypothetical protein